MVKYIVLILGFATIAGVYQNCGNKVAFQDQAPETFATNTSISALECAAGNPTGPSVQIYPSACLLAPGLPAQVAGFEINQGYLLNQNNGSGVYTLSANDAVNGTPEARVLYIEISTYVAPDSVVLTAESANGTEQELLDVCNVGTWDKGDNTQGLIRPLSDTIGQFSVTVPKGTRALHLDFSQSSTPTYVGVWNLGDFSSALSNPANNPFKNVPNTSVNYFRVMSALPSPLNDDADPAYPSLCPRI